MDFKTFEDQFVPFCATPGIKSQKPSSYYRAIQYLADYLGLSEINEDAAKKILDKENEIKNKSSSFYKTLLNDLEKNGRKSYLENGFISAAFPFFRQFIEKRGAELDSSEKKVNMMACQQIFFGAPGTGKSYKVNSILAEQRKNLFASSDIAKSNHYTEVLSNENDIGCNVWIIDCIGILEKKLAAFESDDKRENPRHSALHAYIEWFKKYKEEQREIRTTFHPDYDYAQFVGAYKPKKELNKTTNKEELTYSFVPQVFAKAYVAAWKQYSAAGNASTANSQVYLVIEEINRGNCAQIFGDIFQLLDRDADGFSQYSIDADCDFAEWLKENGIGDGKLRLPPNLNILATMNTSDQSLFPMDSAFKRRFDWEYVPISFTDKEGNEKEAAKYEIDIPDANGKNYLWKNFVEAVNDKILDLTESEDKQLGEFFIKPDSGNVISKERFLGKAMFYLWNEVCKDEHKDRSFFKLKDGSYFTFQDLYRKKDLLKQFMDELLKKE
ncbi:MAG: AAA family ATPase [Fibrobacter sp.]|nr:AAA family ATPase [Fibrobacter sp.]MDY6368653.1 AAA family ATPase [Fibrobacter sp.]MDY6389817.1 AAA family ATPase [Fibrobacter sp.]